MKVFIDTNILLSFYHMTGNDLEELNKLVKLIKKEQLNLLLPSQTIMEYKRNREAKIADAIKILKNHNFRIQFPTLCKDYQEYGKMRDLQKEIEKNHAALLSNIAEDVQERRLKADKLIDQLFKCAHYIEITQEILSSAKTRMDLGNPPGKKRSYGDAVNWEALLAECNGNSDDIAFVSEDKDYCSPLDEYRFDEFLTAEWDEKVGGEIQFYRSLSAFFKNSFPHISMASEIDKEIVIGELAQSGSFASTHSIIARLKEFTDFTPSQANEIAKAAISNSQVTWIITDNDIHEFLKTIIDTHGTKINAEYVKAIEDELKKKEDADALFSIE